MKQFQPTSEMISAAKAVFLAMAFVETVKPIVKGYQTAILEKHRFLIDPNLLKIDGFGDEDPVILVPERTFLMNADDFNVYIQETYEARDKAGLTVDQPDFCPLLVAEELLRKAEAALIETMKPVTKLTGDHLLCAGLDKYEKYIDLTLRLLAPFVGNSSDILKTKVTR